MLEEMTSKEDKNCPWKMYIPCLRPDESLTTQGLTSSVHSTLAPDREIMIPTEQSCS